MKKVKVLVTGRIEHIRQVTRELYPIIQKIEYVNTSKEAQLIILASNFNRKLMIQKIEEMFYNQNKRAVI